mmetsp:Transcript_82201/g.220640  ORF Transcript_82201/g.220640 Transcript_82201/m.220640 type:complete len:132 (+) Transcript_82201:430-825(+)
MLAGQQPVSEHRISIFSSMQIAQIERHKTLSMQYTVRSPAVSQANYPVVKARKVPTMSIPCEATHFRTLARAAHKRPPREAFKTRAPLQVHNLELGNERQGERWGCECCGGWIRFEWSEFFEFSPNIWGII